jgi:hypothetical protein
MWGFIRETISTFCVAGRGDSTVLWDIRGVRQVIFGRYWGKRVTESKMDFFETKAPSPSMSRQCGDLLEKQFPLPVWRAGAIPLCYGVLGGSQRPIRLEASLLACPPISGRSEPPDSRTLTYHVKGIVSK